MSRILCVLCIKSAFLLLLFLSLPTHLPVSLSKDSKFVKTFSLAFFSPPLLFRFRKNPLLTHNRQDIYCDETSSCIKICTRSYGIKSESFVTRSQIFRTEGKKIEISCRALSVPFFFFFFLTRNSTRTRWRRFLFLSFTFFFYRQKFWPRFESYRISRSRTRR